MAITGKNDFSALSAETSGVKPTEAAYRAEAGAQEIGRAHV